MPALLSDITNGSVLFFNAHSLRPRTFCYVHVFQ